jgi:restriction system protein
MALWLVRGGRHGEFEDKFFADSRIYFTWESLDSFDLGKAKDYNGVKEIIREAYPGSNERRTGNLAGQAWAFALPMKAGDLVATPRKHKSAVAVGLVTGPYKFDAGAPSRFCHQHEVKWLNTEVTRTVFGQDLLYSFGAFMTVCEITRNNAEQRVRAIAKSGWKPEGAPVIIAPPKEGGGVGPEPEIGDLEQLARDRIANLIDRKFKGNRMEELVEAILRAQGYTTYRTPIGPDKGVDILAAPGELGFGTPRICVEVKSGDDAVDHPTLQQLIGAMQNVQAQQGLLVSWGGFKSSVDKERARHFFKVRLWDQGILIDQLLEHYHELNEDLKAELPLKRIWTVATQEDE